MGTALNRKWALDTNILLDRAAELDAAKTLFEIAVERGYSLHISKRVMAELADLALNGSEPKLKLNARKALQSLRTWNISELLLPDSAICAQFSSAIRER